MQKEREGNYDLLRIVCAVAVITIHVSGVWLDAVTDEGVFGNLYLNGIMMSCLYHVLSYFAVPCFIMLSGAFALADERNQEYIYFYKKTFKNVGVPTLVFSSFYFLYSYLGVIIKLYGGGGELSELLFPIIEFVKGRPYYHMWYLYTMIGVYMFVPILISLKKQLGEKCFSKLSWVFIVWACLSYWTSTHKLYWDMGFSFLYVGYLMVGYELRRMFYSKKNNGRGFLLIVLGVIVEIIISMLRYVQAMSGVADNELEYKLVASLSPLVVVASVLIFAGFSSIEIRKDFGKLPELTFMVYLFHPFYWTILSKVICTFGFTWDNRVLIPVCVFLLFLVSILSGQIYLKLWKWIEKKRNISDKLCCLFKLT